jgi:hypothetical protein
LDDHTSLNYECLFQDDGKLKCDFVQTRIKQSPGLAETQRMAEQMRARLAALKQ